jgi:large subunit ribosomal protein L24
MKVKVGDNVVVLTGKDKGKSGRIIKTLRKENKVVVEGINMVKKHIKPNRMNEVGSIVDVEAPIHVSNVKVVAEEKKATKKAEVKEAKAEKKTAKTTAKKTTKKTEKKAS